MRTEPLTIPGLAGPVVVESAFFANRYTITAGGIPATRVARNTYALPAAGSGTVQTTVSGGFFDAYPTLTINGVRHRTGPPVPLVMRILAVFPMVVVFAGGALGGVVGALGWAVNMAILRLTMSWAVKALLMLTIAVAAYLTWYLLASAIVGAING